MCWNTTTYFAPDVLAFASSPANHASILAASAATFSGAFSRFELSTIAAISPERKV